MVSLYPPLSVTSATFSLKTHSQHSLLSGDIFPHRRPNHEGLSSRTHGLIYISCTFTGIFHWQFHYDLSLMPETRIIRTKTLIRTDYQNGFNDLVEKVFLVNGVNVLQIDPTRPDLLL